MYKDQLVFFIPSTFKVGRVCREANTTHPSKKLSANKLTTKQEWNNTTFITTTKNFETRATR